MTEQITPTAPRRDFWRILPGILVSLAVLAILFYFVDWQDVLAALKQANYRCLLLGLPVYLISYLLRALAWHTQLKEEVPFKRVFLTMNAGYLLNNVLPFRLGEVGRAFLLGRTGLGFWRVFSTILIERAFDMILASGLLLGTLPFVWGASQSQEVAIVVGGVVLLGLLALYLLARNQQWAMSRYEKLSAHWPRLYRLGGGRINAFFEGLTALVEFPRFLRVFGWMAFSWALGVVYQFVLLLAFDADAKFLWAAFGMATASLGVAMPSSPSYVGVLEAAWVGALALFDIPFSTALAFALVTHSTYIVVTGIFGVYALAREGESLGQLYQSIRKRRFNQ